MKNLLLIANGELRNIPKHWKSARDLRCFVISDSAPDYECADYMHFRSCTFGYYKNSARYSDIPIDVPLLSAMEKYEPQILKMMERYQRYMGLVSYDARINLYHVLIKYWNNYLISNKIDTVFFSVIPHVVFDYTIYCLAKTLNIKTVMLYRTTIVLGGNISLYCISDIESPVSQLLDRTEFHRRNPSAATLSTRMLSYYSFRDENIKNTYTGEKSKDLSKFFKYNSYKNYLSYKILTTLEWWAYLTLRDLIYASAADFETAHKMNPLLNPDLTCNYIYVALHHQPECTTSPMGGAFVHQDLMVELLKSALPEGWKIYIKGHLRGAGHQRFYSRIRFDDRVCLVGERFPSRKLVKRAKAVATVTGTAGFEAFINRIPVLMFGNYFYGSAPGVRKVESIEDVKNFFSDLEAGLVKITDKDIAAFLKALDDVTIEGWVDDRYASMSSISASENCRRIGEYLSNVLFAP